MSFGFGTLPIVDRMKDDFELSELLGTFRGEPCVFSASPVPPDAPRPYVYCGAVVSDVSTEDTKTRQQRVHTRDLIAIADATGTPEVIDQIAERLRALFHRQPLTLEDGWHNYIARVSGPVLEPTDPSLYGRRLTLELMASK